VTPPATRCTYPMDLWNHEKRDFEEFKGFGHLPPGHTLYPKYGGALAGTNTCTGSKPPSTCSYL
jgi:hypothetical protein